MAGEDGSAAVGRLPSFSGDEENQREKERFREREKCD
jgi:hypothetical protein